MTKKRSGKMARPGRVVNREEQAKGRLEAKLAEVKRRQAREAEAEVAESSEQSDLIELAQVKLPWWQVALRSAGWLAWLLASWFLSSFVVTFVAVYIHRVAGFDPLKDVMWVAGLQVVQLALFLIIMVGIPSKFGVAKKLSKAKRRAVNMHLLGLGRLPSTDDIQPLLFGVVGYYVAAYTFTFLASLILPDSVITQAQNVGFAAVGNNWWQVILIALILGVATPIGEELIFRGFFYGKLRRLMDFIWAAIAVSAVFAVAHGQINVGIATFVLSIISCALREKTGAIWSSIGLHMFVNLLAAFLVYVLPMFG